MVLRQLIRAVVYEMRRIFLHKDIRLFVFGAPILYSLLLSSVYLAGSLSEISVGIIDQDQTRLSRFLGQWLDATSGIRIVGYYESVSRAHREMNEGSIEGYVVIPHGFTAEIKRGSDARTLIAVKASNIVLINPILVSFSQAVQSASAALFIRYEQKKGNSFKRAYAIHQSLQANIHFIYNPYLDYSTFIIPGLLLMVMQQVMLVALIFSIVEERELQREALLVQQYGNLEIVKAGKIIAHIPFQFFFTILFTWGILPYFSIQPRSTLILILMFLFSSIAVTALFAANLAWIFAKTTSAMMALMFFSIPAFFLAGFSWPGIALPGWLKALSWTLPSTHFLNSYRLLLLEPLSWSDLSHTFQNLGLLFVLYAGLLIAQWRLHRVQQ